ncbi:MAG: DUF1207 domain-containing protein [Planctomycetaceae bacterium]|nr:DUF1207 domain-containing protein [Planctomycetaceae bacterium]
MNWYRIFLWSLAAVAFWPIDEVSAQTSPMAAYAPMPLTSPVGPLVGSEFNTFRAAQTPWLWHVRPQGVLYHTYWSSAQEPRLGTQIVRTDMGTFQDSSIGGRVGLIKYGPLNDDEGFQLDILGGAKLRQDWDHGLDVLATDFRYDILGTYAEGPHRFKFGFYHISAHTGDEFLARNPGYVRLNFFRDALVLGYSYYPVPELRLYSEVGWGTQTEYSEPWEIQFGFDYGPADPTGNFGAPFMSMNVHLREELNFGGNIAAQAGWAWRGDALGDGVLRTGVYFYDGGTPHQSFYYEHETQWGWGLWYDF